MIKNMLTLLLAGAMGFIFNSVGFGAEYIEIITTNLNDLNHDRAYSWELDLKVAEYDQTIEDISKIELTFKNIRNYNNYENKLFLSVLDSPDGVRDWDNSAVLRHNTVDNYYMDSNNDFENFFLNPEVDTYRNYSNAGHVEQLLSISNLDDRGNDITITFDGLTNPLTSTTTVGGVNDTSELNENTTSYLISANAAAKLSEWAQDGVFELGVDSDCHFYANSVILRIYTTTTPSGQTDAVPEPGTLVLFGLGLLGVSAFGRKRFSAMG